MRRHDIRMPSRAVSLRQLRLSLIALFLASFCAQCFHGLSIPDSWAELSKKSQGGMPKIRDAFGLAEMASKLYVFGGHDGQKTYFVAVRRVVEEQLAPGSDWVTVRRINVSQ
eukprot:2842321-Rhodomonas_salina.1